MTSGFFAMTLAASASTRSRVRPTSGVHTSGCGVLGSVVGDVVSFVSDILDSSIGQFVVQLLTPIVNNLLQGGLGGLLNDLLGLTNLATALNNLFDALNAL